jgi:hypothetical protein
VSPQSHRTAPALAIRPSARISARAARIKNPRSLTGSRGDLACTASQTAIARGTCPRDHNLTARHQLQPQAQRSTASPAAITRGSTRPLGLGEWGVRRCCCRVRGDTTTLKSQNSTAAGATELCVRGESSEKAAAWAPGSGS